MRGSDSISSERSGAVSEGFSEDQAALLEEFFRNHQNELLGTVYYIVGNLQDAQDAVQEAFIRCWNHREQLTEVRNVKAWVFHITLNVARDIRKTAWIRKKKDWPEEREFAGKNEQTPDNLASENEQLALLQKRIAALDEPDKEVFLLRQNGDLTYQQIGELLSIPEGTAKTRMRRAIETLRNGNV